MKAGFSGVSHTINDQDKQKNPKPEYDLIRHDSCHGIGLSKDKLNYGPPGGGNSGFQAVNLAYQMGAKTILLLGFDMFGTHFFGKHPNKLVQSSPFSEFIKAFETIGNEVEIINCSRQTVLNCFPRKRIGDLFR